MLSSNLGKIVRPQGERKRKKGGEKEEGGREEREEEEGSFLKYIEMQQEILVSSILTLVRLNP
jgi:hypothetical protein